MGARGCVVDCLAARIGRDDSTDADMIVFRFYKSKVVSSRSSILIDGGHKKETVELLSVSNGSQAN